MSPVFSNMKSIAVLIALLSQVVSPVHAAELNITTARLTFANTPPTLATSKSSTDTAAANYLPCLDATPDTREVEGSSCVGFPLGQYICSENCWDAVSRALSFSFLYYVHYGVWKLGTDWIFRLTQLVCNAANMWVVGQHCDAPICTYWAIGDDWISVTCGVVGG